MAGSSSTYGQKPLYYGTSNKTPIYYGNAQSPAYYGGRTPYYYGGGAAGASNEDPDSLVGTITFGRVLRVIAQRWISVLVFLLIGLVAAFAVYRISPTVYEAKSEFTMDTRRPQSVGGIQAGTDMEIYGTSYEEIFNTRLSDWRSDKIVTKIVQKYRANYPASTMTDAELMETLVGSELELIRHSRLITIAVRSSKPELAASLANAYAEAIESFTDEENKNRCDKAVTQIHDQVDKQRRKYESVGKDLQEFRTKNNIDSMNSERTTLQQSLEKTIADVLRLEAEITAAAEWEKVLKSAQKNPENFGILPSEVPRSAEIAETYNKRQTAEMELTALLSRFTKNHPEVKAKEKERQAATQAFTEAVSRALATATGNLTAYRNQFEVFQKRSADYRARLAAIELKIVAADTGLKQLEQEVKVASELYQDLLMKENEARIHAEQNNEIVRVGRPATTPTKPVLPNPVVIFAAGAVLSLFLGLLFVLVLDHLEDTVVSLSDIEGRLSLKVLAVLPHVRRKKREQVAKFIAENKYSQFAEAMAGLRNLLDSPRYQPVSQCLLLMSTQPGEGKTITSCSLAISSAQAGKKTLLVDFDMRRPRHARVWGLTLTQEKSFSHYLSSCGTARDFDALVMSTGIDNLSVLCSLPPDNVNPASIMGSQVIPDFFKWAREHYERVVIDSPPFGIVGDVMTLASMVDAVMIMCCPDRTHFKPIQHAARSLGESGATVIGVVVNDVEMGAGGGAFAPSGHSYGYGYGGYGGYRSYGGYRPYAPKETIKTKTEAKADRDGTPKADTGTATAEISASKAQPKAEGSRGGMSAEYADDE